MIVAVVRLVQQDRVPQRIDKQIVQLPIPQISEDSVGECKIVPQEQNTERICEQIVDVPVSQIDVLEAL